MGRPPWKAYKLLRKRVRSEQGERMRATRSVKHLATNWGDREKFPALHKLGCLDPEPFVDDSGDFMIRCKVTGNCFSESEGRGKDWLPFPDELIVARDAIKFAWSPKDLRARDATTPNSIHQDYETPIVRMQETTVALHRKPLA